MFPVTVERGTSLGRGNLWWEEMKEESHHGRSPDGSECAESGRVWCREGEAAAS